VFEGSRIEAFASPVYKGTEAIKFSVLFGWDYFVLRTVSNESTPSL
jgi:hypothetical protein